MLLSDESIEVSSLEVPSTIDEKKLAFAQLTPLYIPLPSSMLIGQLVRANQISRPVLSLMVRGGEEVPERFL